MKIQKYKAVLTFILCFLLISCSAGSGNLQDSGTAEIPGVLQNPGTTEEALITEPPMTGKELSYMEKLEALREVFWRAGPVFFDVIESPEDLQLFRKCYEDSYSKYPSKPLTNNGLVSAETKYDSAFFENHFLIVEITGMSSSSIIVKTSVVRTDDGLRVDEHWINPYIEAMALTLTVRLIPVDGKYEGEAIIQGKRTQETETAPPGFFGNLG